MASRPSRFLKGPVAVTCTIALASALSLPPVALAASDGSSLDAGEARITLQSNGRMLKFDQALINQVGLQHTGGSCLGYAAAYAKTITTGTVHTWAEFDYTGGAYGESGFYGKNMTDEFDCRVIGSESEVLRALYNAINDGHPVVLYVTTGSGSQHWVTVIGYEGVDNPDNLSTDNFIILDPDRTSGLEPESLSSRGLTLRYGDWMGNVRISYASADVDDGRVPSEHFSDCFYGDWFVDSGVVDYVFDHGYITGYAGTTLFGPANGLRRSEAVTILWRVAGKPQVASEKPQFDDANYEDFYYCNTLVTVTADTQENLEWRISEVRRLMISQDMDIRICRFRQEQALLSILPFCKLDKKLFEASKRNMLTSSSASCYPFTSFEMSDENGILLGVNQHNNICT